MTQNICMSVIKNLAKVPNLQSALISRVHKDEVIIEACWSTRNLSSQKKMVTESHYVFKDGVASQPPQRSIRESKIILKAYNNSGNQCAYVHQDEEKNHIVLFDQQGAVSTINLNDVDKHGKIYCDCEFSALVFSPDSAKLAFVAEKKKPKPASFLDKKPKSDDDDSSSWGQKNAYVDTWGEQLEEIHQSCIVIIDIASEDVSVIDFPSDLCGGQIEWAPDNYSLVGTAFVTTPFRLGLIYCANRLSVLFRVDVEGKFDEITPRNHHVKRPRFNPARNCLFFLRCQASGTHQMATQLCKLDWKTREVSVLIDDVDDSVETANGLSFKGLTGFSSFPRRCFSMDGMKIFLNTLVDTKNIVCIINTEDGCITRFPFDNGSLVVHDYSEGWLLLSGSSIVSPNRLFLWHEDWNLKCEALVGITNEISLDGLPSSWVREYVCEGHENAITGSKEFPVIFCGPSQSSEVSSKRPLIVWCHGGPHSLIANAYSHMICFFLRIGYSIVFPNFRGSIGQGKKCIDSLPGNIGDTDVKDCHMAAVDCLQRFENVLDPAKVVLFGGSHGGFLIAHLSGLYPDFYKAVCSRNPALDIGVMSYVSDIPDWSFVENGGSYEMGKLASADDLVSLRKKSPMSLAGNVKAPTLFFLGNKDKRVPMSQGLLFHKILKARGIDTSAYIYDDCHSLAKVDVDVDVMMQSALWFDKYLK